MNDGTRRTFLGSALAGAALLTACSATTEAGDTKLPGAVGDEGVSPPEDLMREHGGLNRILLIYDESVRRIEAQQPFPVDALAKSADIIRRFIEQYHEKLEEDFLFPRLEKAGREVELVATLRRQHKAGRAVTAVVLQLATEDGLKKDDDRKRLVASLRSFVRMYRPHEAREDTIVFPAFRDVVSKHELHDLGEQFEDREHQLFGKPGFEGIVKEIAELEKAFGIYDLEQFTPAT